MASLGCEILADPLQIAPGGGDVSLELIQSILQRESVTAAALQLIANAPRLVLELRQRFSQGARLALESFNGIRFRHAVLPEAGSKAISLKPRVASEVKSAKLKTR